MGTCLLASQCPIFFLGCVCFLNSEDAFQHISGTWIVDGTWSLADIAERLMLLVRGLVVGRAGFNITSAAWRRAATSVHDTSMAARLRQAPGGCGAPSAIVARYQAWLPR